MAPLKLSKLVSYSSEDPLFPASNLLGKGKWKCKEEGEKQAWVLMQLEETSVITNIDIGNAGAAFVEVQVGRLGADPDQMKVLLVASSFMSVNEARVGENMGRVRMFGADKLSKEVAKEKWDLVKVVLTQPFTKLLKYGLSFISLSGPTAPKPTPSPAQTQHSLGAFRLKAEPEQNIAVGTLFARQKAATSPPSVAASLRDEGTVSNSQQKKRKREVNLTPAMVEEAKKRKVGPKLVLPSRISLPGEESVTDEEKAVGIFKKNNSDVTKLNKKTESEVSDDKGKTKNAKKNKADKIDKKVPVYADESPAAAASTKVSKTKPKRFAPFSDLLKGVVFTISGFQNPLRGEIRKKGLDLGAKYCGDWNSSCTHLICAFTNTPKFNQVVGKGKIVKKDWLEECFKQRKKLPWRRFCLDKKDQLKDESEDEVWERTDDAGKDETEMDTDEEIEMIKREEKERKTNGGDTSAYECDTDEEIEKIKASETDRVTKEENRSSPQRNTNPYDCDTDDEADEKDKSEKKNINSESVLDSKTDIILGGEEADPYDAETDIDEEEIVKLLPDTQNLRLGSVPEFFDKNKFLLHGDFQPGERVLLERYIIACGGQVEPYMEESVMFVITHSRWNKMFDEAIHVSKGVQFVKPRWLFKCKDEGRMVELGDCRIDK